MRFWILFALLILSACVKPPEIIKESFEEKVENVSNETTQEKVQEGTQIPYAELEKQRKRESVKNLFDFLILTAENCDFYYSYMQKLIIENNRDRDFVKDDLRTAKEKIDEYFDSMKAAEAANDEASADNFKEKYDDEFDEAYDLEKEIEALDKKEDNLNYVLSEVKEDCIFLKKEKGLNTIKQ
ncbi:MAG TPA: hypothetical protein VJB94_02810 [Candidatus Nanoarchaeia archaeon]|nr:hypothetical protein [Candidatus Nanoarchaeia archaeon]